MRRLTTALAASAMLCAACATASPRATIVPDELVPHQLAEDVQVVIWVRQADGKLVPVRRLAPAGWWIAGPAVVDAPR